MNTIEAFTWAVVLSNPTPVVFEAISKEPLLIYYKSGETHYISWNVVLPVGQKKPVFDLWCGKLPIRELTDTLNRICIVAGLNPTLTFGSLRLNIKYPYTSHHVDKILSFTHISPPKQ